MSARLWVIASFHVLHGGVHKTLLLDRAHTVLWHARQGVKRLRALRSASGRAHIACRYEIPPRAQNVRCTRVLVGFERLRCGPAHLPRSCLVSIRRCGEDGATAARKACVCRLAVARAVFMAFAKKRLE